MRRTARQLCSRSGHPLREVLDDFPAVRYAFAYGSGAVRQEGYEGAKKPMIDFVLVVDDPCTWHKENLVQNRGHYSGIMARSGDGFRSWVQDAGAGVFYNPLASRLVVHTPLPALKHHPCCRCIGEIGK